MNKLFKGGFGVYEYFAVAEDEAEAITKIKEQYNMQAFPVTVALVDNVDGFTIAAFEEDKTYIENCTKGYDDLVAEVDRLKAENESMKKPSKASKKDDSPTPIEPVIEEPIEQTTIEDI